MKKLLLLLIIPLLSFGQTPITNININQAVDLWFYNQVSAEETYGNISEWDVSNVTNMYRLFWADESSGGMGGSLPICENEADISNWDVSNVTNMSQMFMGSCFEGDISNWDVSNVTDMSSMFLGGCFNGDISNWDVSNVTDMSSMFRTATNQFATPAGGCFNGDISNWNVSNVTDMSNIFVGNNVMSIENYDALLNCWSTLELQQNVILDCSREYCTSAYARASIIFTFAWDINDGGLYDDGGSNFCNQDSPGNCNNTFVSEIFNTKSLIKTIDLLGRDTNSKGFNIEIYDDGSVQKKYVIE